MDEYDGVLRVAVTETDRNGESTNSLYTLRQEGGALVVAGALTGMGITERIYGVRFFGETGYIVTFRQTDPLYTLDLSEYELEGFHKSCQHIRDNIAQLDWWDTEAYDAK